MLLVCCGRCAEIAFQPKQIGCNTFVCVYCHELTQHSPFSLCDSYKFEKIGAESLILDAEIMPLVESVYGKVFRLEKSLRDSMAGEFEVENKVFNVQVEEVKAQLFSAGAPLNKLLMESQQNMLKNK